MRNSLKLSLCLLLLGGVAFGQRAMFYAHTGLCAIPNFCSPTNTAVDQNSAPGALLGPTGLGARFTDITGNLIVRASDYSMAGSGGSAKSFRATSDSNDNVWSSDNKAVGFCRTGGALYIDAFNPQTRTVTAKGWTASKGACDLVSWSHATPMSWFYASGNVLTKATIDTSSGTWTGSTGGDTDISAAINTSALLDISASCAGLAYNRYAGLADIYNLDAADRYIGFAVRSKADESLQTFVFDQVNGCHWNDLRTMTMGGAWGYAGTMSFANSVLLPVPPAPTLTATTGGALNAAHSYRACITYVKNNIGETPCSTATLITPGGGNSAFTITPPTANPANTISKASGINVYACDDTASPGCTPVLQSDGTNASGVLAQPTGLSAACTANCSGTRSYIFRIYASNAAGQSPISAAFTTAATMGDNATFTISVNQVANAATYTVLTDFTYNSNIIADAGTCGAGVCTFTENTNNNAVTFSILQNQTVPIATTPTITALAATGITAPAVNSTGVKNHNAKVDGTGKWSQATVVSTNLQTAYSSVNPNLLLDETTGTALILNGPSAVPAMNVSGVCAGHHVVGFGTYMGKDCNTGAHFYATLNDSSATVDASQVNMDAAGFPACCDEHFSSQMQSPTGANFPWYIGSDSGITHSIPVDYLALYTAGLRSKAAPSTVWKFCQNWQSGLQGFNSQVSGNVSPSGKFILFSSDMGVGVGVTSGQMGNTSGGASCTDGVDCRTDAFICATR